MITQSPSKVVVPGSSLIIVGSEINTMLESSWDMNEPIVVLVNTVYLYCNETAVEPAISSKPNDKHLFPSLNHMLA